MSTQILDGLELSKQIRKELTQEVSKWIEATKVVPKIDFLVNANDPASIAYVEMKKKWAAQVGMHSGVHYVTNQTTQQEASDLIAQLNNDVRIHGILVQHPLPFHLDEANLLFELGAEKDVDGMTPQSLGLLASDMPGFRCATPLGILSLLEHYKIELEGKNALVIGRSIILGKPMALMLLQKNATVTIAHSKTKNLLELCQSAEILIAGAGRPELIHGNMLRKNCVVIDAGFSKVENRIQPVGDVHFESAKDVASWITPVPGGVGPMTVATLLRNTFDAAKKQVDSVY